MAGASQSRLAKAGGNAALARQQFEAEIASGRANLSADQQALLQRDPEGFFGKYLGQSTKGKYSGVLGGAVKLIGKAAPLAALIPGVGIPLAAGIGAAGGLARGGGFSGALQGAAVGGGGAALLGGQGIGGLGNIKAGLGKLGLSPAQAAQFGLAGLGMIQGAKQQGQANALNQQTTDQLREQYLAQDQLRRQALGRLQQPAGAYGNPFGGR